MVVWGAVEVRCDSGGPLESSRHCRLVWIFACACIQRAKTSKGTTSSVRKWVPWYSNHLILSSLSNRLNTLCCVVSSSNEAKEPGWTCLNNSAAWHLWEKEERAVGSDAVIVWPWMRSWRICCDAFWGVLNCWSKNCHAMFSACSGEVFRCRTRAGWIASLAAFSVRTCNKSSHWEAVRVKPWTSLWRASFQSRYRRRLDLS